MIDMFKIILKNLWQRRRQNAWLFAELIIVTILTWVIVDPIAVGIYDINSDLGYDADRIVRVSIKTYPKEADQYNPAYEDQDAIEEAYTALRTKAGQLPMVEICSHLDGQIDDQSTSTYGMKIGDEAVDTLAGRRGIYALHALPGEKFFSLYGIESTKGSPSAEELDSDIMGGNDVVITESVDRAFWPDRRGVMGKRFLRGVSDDGDTTFTNVKAIVKDFRYHAATRTGATLIFTQTRDYRSKNNPTLTLRLVDGVNADDYVRDYSQIISDQLRIGNYYVCDIMSQNDQIEYVARANGTSTTRNLYFFIGALFLINLIVGVVGCVWLQTGKRLAELGVLRSYGALRSQIIKMLIGESVAMATVAFIIGDLIYLQYALKEGLSIGYENNSSYIQPQDLWIDNFGEHFMIVSAIVFALIIICVIIGSYFPARHVSKIEPVDALRDE